MESIIDKLLERIKAVSTKDEFIEFIKELPEVQDEFYPDDETDEDGEKLDLLQKALEEKHEEIMNTLEDSFKSEKLKFSPEYKESIEKINLELNKLKDLSEKYGVPFKFEKDQYVPSSFYSKFYKPYKELEEAINDVESELRVLEFVNYDDSFLDEVPTLLTDEELYGWRNVVAWESSSLYC